MRAELLLVSDSIVITPRGIVRRASTYEFVADSKVNIWATIVPFLERTACFTLGFDQDRHKIIRACRTLSPSWDLMAVSGVVLSATVTFFKE